MDTYLITAVYGRVIIQELERKLGWVPKIILKKGLEKYYGGIGICTHNYPKSEGDRADAGVFVSDFVEELSKSMKFLSFIQDPS